VVISNVCLSSLIENSLLMILDVSERVLYSQVKLMPLHVDLALGEPISTSFCVGL
jgi:hypothetical protein